MLPIYVDVPNEYVDKQFIYIDMQSIYAGVIFIYVDVQLIYVDMNLVDMRSKYPSIQMTMNGDYLYQIIHLNICLLDHDRMNLP